MHAQTEEGARRVCARARERENEIHRARYIDARERENEIHRARYIDARMHACVHAQTEEGARRVCVCVRERERERERTRYIERESMERETIEQSRKLGDDHGWVDWGWGVGD